MTRRRRRLVVAPRAERDFQSIVAWYRRALGAAAAAKVARTLRAGLASAATIHPSAASRPDLPAGYFRVVAKVHLIVFRIQGDESIVLRILHGGRDLPDALAEADAH